LAKAELIGHDAAVQCRFLPRRKLITQGMCARVTLRFWWLYDYQSSYAVIVRDIHSTVGPFLLPNDVWKLSAATDGFRLAIHGDPEFTGSVLVADP
jgi:hypothetical protein